MSERTRETVLMVRGVSERTRETVLMVRTVSEGTQAHTSCQFCQGIEQTSFVGSDTKMAELTAHHTWDLLSQKC